MERRSFIKTIGQGSMVLLALPVPGLIKDKETIRASIRQITNGQKHHFFGYIGQSLTIPWNSKGNRILALGSSFHDHLPGSNEPADVNLVHLDKPEGKFFKVEKVDESLGWNLQQGTMFYWNPEKPATQFFFNDRDPQTGKVFTVLYDIKAGRRIREFKFEDTPVGNSGVCPAGKSFLAINYARMARLRPVTGYRDAADWTVGKAAPGDDGIFVVDIRSGEKRLLVSFATLDAELNKKGFVTNGEPLFINHTLWNRDGEYVYFYVRGGWQAGQDRKKRIDVICTIKSDGTDLYAGHNFIGGHPEWGAGHQIIGSMNGKQVIYDVLEKKLIGTIGTPEAIPSPEGDISLSPDGKWFVNGFSREGKNYYNILRLADGLWVRTEGIDKGAYEGDIRIDPSPRWNRKSNQILVDGITENGTRQMFIIKIIK